MDNRIYYGEYSLKHWINLVLKKNIILPPYQRLFVWDEKKVKTLMDTFNKKQFVPPVTIGAYRSEDNERAQNLILDGQQRITSILLAYLGIFPGEKEFKAAKDQFASENDEPEEEDEPNWDNILEWNLNQLTQKGSSKNKIVGNLIDGNYKNLDLEIEEEFWETTFLGFSYLVPEYTDQKKQQTYYSSVFRNINIQGQVLLPQESRQALYFLDKDLVDLFNPPFSKGIIVKLTSSETKADFVRYLSLLAQYYYHERFNQVARGYKPRMEELYEKYIDAVITDKDSDMFGQFTNVVPDKDYRSLLEKIESLLAPLGIAGEHPSIIDVDVYLFGLIHQILFLKRNIDEKHIQELRNDLKHLVERLKANEPHRRAPNNLTHLRWRIEQSIEIYSKYVS